MNNASLELGGTNWAEKEGSLLGYAVNDTNNKYSPQEFTFGRGTNLSATRIGQTGLIEKGRENVLLQSNQFDTTWIKVSGSVTSGQSGYDGTNDAFLLNRSAAFGGYVYQSNSQSGVKTFSVYAKANTQNWIRLRQDNASQYFDLENGVLGTGGNIIDASIEAVSGAVGWYRCVITHNESTTYARVQVADGDNDTSGTSGSIYIQDSQLEQGLAASPYIETTTTTAQAGVLENTPRLNYTTGVANPYLLLEPSRTNAIDSSEYAGAWSAIDSNITKTDNATTSPEGVNNAVKLEGLTGSANNQIVNFGTTLLDGVNVVGKTYTASVYIKPVNPSDVGDDISLSIQRSNGDYEGLNVTFEIDSADWKRYDLTYTFTGAGAGDQVGASFKILRADTTIDDIYVYGVQLEEGSYPTSYIPTYSTSATRAVDTSSKADASADINSTEGVLYAEIAALADDGTNRGISISDGTSTNRITFLLSSQSNTLRVFGVAGALQFNLQNSSFNTLNYNKIAVLYQLNNFKFFINGTQVGSSTSGAVPIGLNSIFFDNGSGGLNFYGKVNALQVYKEALTDTELATLTTI